MSRSVLSAAFLKHLPAALVLLVMGTAMITSVVGDSATMDEPVHIVAGYAALTSGDYRLSPEHPPLVRSIAALPLLALHPRLPAPGGATDADEWVIGQEFLYRSGVDSGRLLFWARMPIVLLTLGLGMLVYAWSARLFGRAGGFISLVLFAFDPNILAHGRYVTTDMGLAAGFLLAAYALWRLTLSPSVGGLVAATLAVTACALAKFSAPVLFVTVAVALFVVWRTGRPEDAGDAFFERLFAAGVRQRAVRLAALAAVAFVAMAVCVWVVYAVQTRGVSVEQQQRLIDGRVEAASGAQGPLHALTVVPGLRPLGLYATGLSMVTGHAVAGHQVYFMGGVGKVWRYYYPLMLGIKTPIAVMLLLGLASALFRPSTREQRFARLLLLALAGSVLAAGMVSSLNMGVRHVLAVYPPLYVLAGALGVVFGRGPADAGSGPVTRTTVAASAMVALLIAWTVAVSLAAWPGYLAYYNEFAGGKAGGSWYAVDANFDWGQDLLRLRDWMDATGVDAIRVDYFGGALPAEELKGRLVPWDGQHLSAPGWYAVSMTSFRHKTTSGLWTWKDRLRPFTVVGDTILVYRVGPGEVEP